MNIYIYMGTMLWRKFERLEAILSNYILIYHFWEVEEVGEFTSCYYGKSNCQVIEKET